MLIFKERLHERIKKYLNLPTENEIYSIKGKKKYDQIS